LSRSELIAKLCDSMGNLGLLRKILTFRLNRHFRVELAKPAK
jgi:hypothetical protein